MSNICVVVVLILVDLESNMLQGAKLWKCFGHVWTVWSVCLGSIETAAKFQVVAAKVPVMYPMQSPEQRNSRTVKGVVQKSGQKLCRSYSEIFLNMLGDCWMVQISLDQTRMSNKWGKHSSREGNFCVRGRLKPFKTHYIYHMCGLPHPFTSYLMFTGSLGMF